MSLREIFRAEGLPVLQNRLFQTREEALSSVTGDVVLVQNSQTGLIYNDVYDAAKLVYDENYQNEQAYSETFKKHLEQVATIIDKHLCNQRLIEVGCGKGYFLELLKSKGYVITGVDPAYEGSNSQVICAPFTRDLGISGDGLILRHVLEHIHEPLDFLHEIAVANGGKGKILIEVPTFDWIVGHRAWFDIFYEHVNYFRISDFYRMFGRVYESGLLFGGQYCYVVADLASLKTPRYDASIDAVTLPGDFQQGLSGIVAKLRSKPQQKFAIWGAASKGVICSVYMKKFGVIPDFAIDVNPFKQGRFIAVSGVEVLAPAQALVKLSTGDKVFIMNANYRDEIIAQSGNRFAYLDIEDE